MSGKWTFDGLYILNGSVVGTAAKAPNGQWYAHGCMSDWQDVKLGAHNTEGQARKAVKQWVKENL